jgi:hypothetical protein
MKSKGFAQRANPFLTTKPEGFKDNSSQISSEEFSMLAFRASMA